MMMVVFWAYHMPAEYSQGASFSPQAHGSPSCLGRGAGVAWVVVYVMTMVMTLPKQMVLNRVTVGRHPTVSVAPQAHGLPECLAVRGEAVVDGMMAVVVS